MSAATTLLPSPAVRAAGGDTIVDVLRAHAGSRPERMAYTFLPELETAAADRLDYQGLAHGTDLVAAGLDAWFAERPEQPRMALLLFPAGMEFLTAFWGCLAGRVVAIPAPMPRPGRPLTALEGLVGNAGVPLVLTADGQEDAVRRILDSSPALAPLEVTTVERTAAAGVGRPVPHAPAAEDIAFLQYTSGSTSRPKGVVVRHRNLLANERMIATAMGVNRNSTVVNWMPHYHDMGLIGSLLQPIYGGAGCHTMAPTTFLKRPLRWLKTIASAHTVASGGPDFAYRLCVERITPEQAATLDLSSWCVAFSGAEPVRATTLDSFAARFADAGFRREALYPCYGMAEATLLASGSRAGRGALLRPQPSGWPAVCSGWAPPEARITVVDPASLTRCPDGVLGEIWLSGPHIADGYHNDAERTAEAFGAAIAGPGAASGADPGPWLRTGDLGYLIDGGLYVTGRLKEMMIVNGRNVYPHDVEDALLTGLPEIRDAAVFALPAPGGRERVVALLELDSGHRRLILNPGEGSGAALEAIARAARTRCAQSCDLPIDHVRIALPGAVPKTTSGKTRYGELRARLAALPAATFAAPLSAEAGRSRQEEA